MTYVIAIHLLGGILIGSLFPVGMLLVLLSFEIISSIVLAFAFGPVPFLAWLAVVAALQVGYVAGVLASGLLEQATMWRAHVRRRRIL